MIFSRQDFALAVTFLVALSAPSCCSQHVIETGAPLGLQILDPGPLSANKPTVLKCEVTGAGPNTNITWWLEGKPLTAATIAESETKNTTLSLLQFRPLKKHTGLLLKCRAENEENSESAVEKEMKINVRYAPTATLQLGQFIKQDSLVEYNDMYFECVVRANPPPREITWQQNGIRLEKSHNIQMAGNALVLQNISPGFDGEYTCSVSNEEGRSVSNPVNIRVQHKPVCKRNETKRIAAKFLETIKIECSVKAFPSIDAIQWTFNNSDGIKNIDRQRFTVVTEEGKSVLSYKPVSDSDYGTLQCWAANNLGRQASPCTFIIQHPSAPQPPKLCILNSADTKTLLACTPEYAAHANKENITYRAEILTSDWSKVLQHTTWPFWEVKNFDARDSKQIVIYASNEYGESKRTFTVETFYRLSPTTD